jgi:hypothetical protein
MSAEWRAGPSSLDECRDLFLETKRLNAGGPLHQ